MRYEPIRSINFQNGLNVSASPLSPLSENTLADGWNAIVSGDGYVRPFSGATSQGAGSGSRKMLPFANTWGGIRDIGYSDNTFLTSSISANTVTTTTAHGWITGLSCQLTTAGTFPSGLAAATTYYLIVTGASTVKFASTLANALLGTAIAIANVVTSTITIDVSNASVTASGNFFQDIGLSRWGIGAGQPMIAGASVSGYQLSTNLQVQIAVAGVYGPPVQAGLSQPSAPQIGIINTTGSITNSISAKLERSRPSTGAISVASPMSAVVMPQANRIYLVFPAAQAGQTHWRAFFTFQGFGGVGIAYLGSYLGLTDIPESIVAAGVAGGGATATGTVTIGTNPADGDTLTIDGEVFTFKTVVGDPSTEILIGANTTATATNTASTLTPWASHLALYTPSANIVTVTASAPGTTGNAFTLASSVSPAKIQLSGATLAGGVSGIARSLEFNFQDGDLIPIEASFDDYAPPAGTHAIRLNTVMNIAGCYADSTTGPTTTNPGTCIAISKENNYESYVPTSLLYLSEQVVDVLARPLDDYGYIGCQNSISAIQYVGPRGDGQPSCTITTILPDIGVQYMHNWCYFRGQLLIYTAQGNLLLMDSQGDFDTSFANPVTKTLKSFTTASTSVGYDSKNDSIVVMSGKQVLVYSLQSGQWRQIWLPDFSLSGTSLSCVAAQRQLYFTLTSGGVNTAYTYDTGSATAPLSFVSNYQNAGGSTVQDIYEMAISAQTNVSTKLAVVINRNLTQTAFRQITTTSSSAHIGSDGDSFSASMEGKTFILFGTNIGGTGTVLLQGTITSYNAPNDLTLSSAVSATLSDCLMFVGDWGANSTFNVTGWPPNFNPNRVEYRGYQIAVWLQSSGTVGNVLTCDLLGTAYPSARAGIGSGTSSPCTADAIAFYTAAGITDTTQQQAICTLVTALKDYNLWSKFNALYPFVGGTATTCKYNLKDPRDLDAAFRIVWQGGITFDANGVTGNGSTGYGDTKLNAATSLTLNDTHLSLYSRSSTDWTAEPSQFDIGYAATSKFNMGLRAAGSFDSQHYSTAGHLFFVNADAKGFYISSRTSSSAAVAYKNGVVQHTVGSGAGALESLTVGLLGVNANGTPAAGTARQYAFASIGTGLTPTESANFYLAVQAFQVSLGRSV